ncbi:hypothetical protein E2C01_072805 [Portunus trituberculatus]|uniref:Uncharacterized protein n=1 Tax=Portunus trituberculatus TaxID=210409 RepID=A0A5B7HZ16_PORTR|nr:hypothetical protein [Portunus trituberculatus]
MTFDTVPSLHIAQNTSIASCPLYSAGKVLLVVNSNRDSPVPSPQSNFDVVFVNVTHSFMSVQSYIQR